MSVRQVRHGIREEFQEDQEPVKRIFVQAVRAREQVIEELVFVNDLALQESLGELVLVTEMIEEAGLGDAGFGNHFVKRRGRKSLPQDRRLRDVENALSRLFALASDLNAHGVPIAVLYLKCGFRRRQCGSTQDFCNLGTASG
jgi:hypothetical protein